MCKYVDERGEKKRPYDIIEKCSTQSKAKQSKAKHFKQIMWIFKLISRLFADFFLLSFESCFALNGWWWWWWYQFLMNSIKITEFKCERAMLSIGDFYREEMDDLRSIFHIWFMWQSNCARLPHFHILSYTDT